MAKLILIICVFVTAVFAKCSIRSAEQSLSKSVNEFSIDLVKKISESTDNHFIASTLSTWMLLAYVSLGAAGTSLEELNAVLRLDSRKDCTQKSFEITKGIYTSNDVSSLKGASAIFIDEHMKVLNKFRCRVMEAGVTDIQQVSVENTERVAATINSYIKSATNGTIEKLVDASGLEDLVMMVVDVLLFKSAWKTPFQVEKTKESPFYDELSNVVGRVNLMTITDMFNAWSVDQIEANVVELPYSDNKFSMYLFVPYQNVQLSNVINAIKIISLRSILELLKKQELQEVTVSLPRFKMSSNINNLEELLIDMGLKAVFDSDKAFFRLISHRPVYISNMLQKAVVEVTEEGTTASAATEADFAFKSFPLTVTATKPFFFTIVDKKTQIPVFAGAYSKPSVY